MNLSELNGIVSMYCAYRIELWILGWSSRRRPKLNYKSCIGTYEEDDVEKTENVLGHGGPTAQTCRHLGFCCLFSFFSTKKLILNFKSQNTITFLKVSEKFEILWVRLTPSLNFSHFHKLIPTCSRFCAQLCGGPACFKLCVSTIDFECININV